MNFTWMGPGDLIEGRFWVPPAGEPGRRAAEPD
jgi:hypothetical protein